MAQATQSNVQKVVGPMTRFLYREIVLVLTGLIGVGLLVAILGTHLLSADLIESQACNRRDCLPVL